MLLEQYPCRCRVLASSNITTDHQVLKWPWWWLAMPGSSSLAWSCRREVTRVADERKECRILSNIVANVHVAPFRFLEAGPLVIRDFQLAGYLEVSLKFWISRLWKRWYPELSETGVFRARIWPSVGWCCHLEPSLPSAQAWQASGTVRS